MTETERQSTPHQMAGPVSTVPLLALVEQLAGFVRSVERDRYAEAVDATGVGAMGGHVRHSIDHLLAWARGLESGVIDYDDRVRGTPIETEPDAALQALQSFAETLRSVHVRRLAEPVTVRTALSATGEKVSVPSTLARELAFVFSHTVHHNAIISAMANACGMPLPEGFGVAPSTLAYRAVQDEG